MSRDPVLERKVLDHLDRAVWRRFGVRPSGSSAAVMRRLEMGAERYGDAFLDRDNITEAAEECRDLAAYVLLELQRLAGAPAEVRDNLLRAAMLAAAADHYLRRARRRLREEASS